MKKLLLIAITTFCSIGAYAQANELNCTEQAVTFKINLHGNSSKIGRFDPVQMGAGFKSSNAYTGKQSPSEISPPLSFENTFNPAAAYIPNNTIPLKKMTFPYPKINYVTGKFTPTTYDHFKLLPMPVVNNLTPLLN
ncbi:hypothetical protein ACFFGT_00980 [Mucilaginibacter angelicae]|uniref:Uncharacterized protein n=1 Tax=Mucilaginibacter angelicae TaxID=869718 RepID=A0ABV6KZ34_9SPHI